MPQAPNSYDPYTKPDTAKERRDVVLYTMYDNKNLESRVRKAKATPIDEGLVPLKASDDNRKVVDNYVKEVINEVKAKTGKMFTQTD